MNRSELKFFVHTFLGHPVEIWYEKVLFPSPKFIPEGIQYQ